MTNEMDMQFEFPRRCDIESPQQQLLSRKMIHQGYVLYQQGYGSQSHVDQTHKLSWSSISLVTMKTYSFA
jgi:hypothetical protein